jgi:hypothetical protein
MAQITFDVVIPKSIHEKTDGALFWTSFMRHFPSHIPVRMGFGVNATTPFDPDNLDAVLETWDKRTLYFEGDPRLSLGGQVLRSRRGTAHLVHTEMLVYAFEDEPASVKHFIYEMADAFQAFYATAHILTREQLRWRARSRPPRPPRLARRQEEALQRRLEVWPRRTVLGPEIQTVNTRRGYIHDLYWLNLLGPAYVSFFGRERVLTTPAHQIDELPYGGIGVQLTPDIDDTPAAWERFLVARGNAKSSLDNNAFFDPALPRSHIYAGPVLGSR